jgi:hypothetical protein
MAPSGIGTRRFAPTAFGELPAPAGLLDAVYAGIRLQEIADRLKSGLYSIPGRDRPEAQNPTLLLEFDGKDRP